MVKTVILVQSDSEAKKLFSVRDPSDAHPAMRDLYPFVAAGLRAVFVCTENGSEMRVVGEILYDALRKHPAIREYLFDGVVRENGLASEPHPIYFQVDSDDVDDLPFEALHHRDFGFLALKRWPIARMQDQTSNATPRLAVHDFFYPLRFMAVLSATAESDALEVPSAEDQWEALLPELERGDRLLAKHWKIPQGEALEVRVLTNDDRLIEKINALERPRIRAEQIGETAQALIDKRSEFRPHLLHLFCHGLGGKQPHLILGTRRDYMTRQPGSLTIQPGHLTEKDRAVWIVTLNSCSGAANTGGVQSFAKSLVRNGTPTAVGMREPIDVRDASILCSAFYRKVFERIGEIGLDKDSEEIDWSFALQEVRIQMLGSKHNGKYESHDCRHWAIPVLYRTTDPFRVRYRGERTKERMVALKFLEGLKNQRRSLSEMVTNRMNFKGFDSAGALLTLDAEIEALEKSIAEGQ